MHQDIILSETSLQLRLTPTLFGHHSEYCVQQDAVLNTHNPKPEKLDNVVELVGEGSVINGAYPV